MAEIEFTPRHLLTGMLISVGILVISAFVLIYQGILQNWVNELLYLLLFYVLFQNSSLIWGFAIYFAIWHSLPSLLDQVKFLSGSIKRQTILDYIKSSLIYWIMSILGLMLFVYFFKDREELFLTLFFTFLAAITFPHVVVMHRLFDQESMSN
jgi:Brp/Blh family beta-carotene 15,15'-monooxygenase